MHLCSADRSYLHRVYIYTAAAIRSRRACTPHFLFTFARLPPMRRSRRGYICYMRCISRVNFPRKLLAESAAPPLLVSYRREIDERKKSPRELLRSNVYIQVVMQERTYMAIYIYRRVYSIFQQLAHFSSYSYTRKLLCVREKNGTDEFCERCQLEIRYGCFFFSSDYHAALAASVIPESASLLNGFRIISLTLRDIFASNRNKAGQKKTWTSAKSSNLMEPNRLSSERRNFINWRKRLKDFRD